MVVLLPPLNYLQGVTSLFKTKNPADGDNVNVLSLVTPPLMTPSGGVDNYLFLVVDKSDGSLKAIDKTFITEG